MSDNVKARVIEQAKADAALFVKEFGEPIDPDTTDWDAVAWGDVRRELQLDDDESDAMWPVYQAALVAETENLCSTN